MTEAKPMPKSFPWLYFFMNVGQTFGITVAMSYLMFFLTDYAGITPAVVATILLVSRVVDFVFSVIAGPIVQKSNMRWGQFRSWIMICVILVQVGCVMMFLNPNIASGAKVIIVGIGYILQNAPMNFLVTATNGLMAKVAGPNMENRMQITAKMMQGMNFANILVSMITLPLITWFLGKNLNGYLIVTVMYGAIMILSSFLVFIKTKEYDQYDPNFKATTVSVGQIYGDLLKNPMVWVLLIANIFSMTSMMVMMSLPMYYHQFSIGTLDYQPIAMTIASISGLIAAFIMAPVARKVGKKNSAVISAVCTSIWMTLIAFFADGNIWAYIGLSACNTFTAALIGSIGVNLWLDAAEYQLYKTGIDTRPTAMSMANVPMKIGMAVSSPIVAVVLNSAGYTQQMVEGGPPITSMSDPKTLVMWMGLFPAAISLVNAIIYMFGYKITDAKAAEYAAANQKTMMEKMAAAGAGAPGGPGGPG